MNPSDELIAYVNEVGGWEDCRTFERNAFLKRSVSVVQDIFYIESGSVRAFIEAEGEEHNIRFGYAGSIITPLDSYITGQPSDLYIQALKKTSVRIISKKRFTEILDGNEHIKGRWLELLQLLVVQFMERERDLLTHSPAERYRRVLKRSPSLFQEIPRKHIASYLRMTPETLSRVSKQNLDSNQ